MRPKLELPKTFTFSTEIPVQVTDINYAGHLGNDKVVSYIHEARVRFLKKFGFTELDVDGAGTIMVHATIIYKAEAFHGDILKIEVAPGNFHKLGCDFFYRLTNAKTGKEVARAKTGLIFFDYEKQKMVLMPEKFKENCNL
ncbi:thioesterase family protein [candidate division KSB1 bacterium]|nr:thioesterase family protein [candidate division KSB1 bacterium]